MDPRLESSPQDKPCPPWKILVVDDDEDIHFMTKLMLKNLRFEQRELLFIHAFSAKDSLEKLSEHTDTAVVLLDVEMERPQAGFEVICNIRQIDPLCRIIIRTGQAGSILEEEAIRRYDINDYREKTELTKLKLNSCVMGALRSYRDLLKLEQEKSVLKQTVSQLK